MSTRLLASRQAEAATDTIRVLVADDHGVVREGLRRILDAEAGIHVIGEAASGEEAVARALQLRPDVIIMDIKMPGMGGISATREIKRRLPDTHVLVLTLYGTDFISQAVSAGASGYLLKEASAEEIAGAIRSVQAGATAINTPPATPRPDYSGLTERNWGFITPEAQARIRTTRVLLAGCGLGSRVATLAARTGFARFILADGDTVELSNLNRQAFRLAQLGRNKAEATAELVREINPAAEVEVLPRFIAAAEADELVSRADVVVNMVDPGPALYAINHAATRQNKVSLFPLNIGFGAMALAFGPGSATLEEMVGKGTGPEMLFFKLVEAVLPEIPYVADYTVQLAPVIDDILSGRRAGPQLGVAVAINASLLVTAMIRATLHLPLRLAPRPLALDAWVSSGENGDKYKKEEQ